MKKYILPALKLSAVFIIVCSVLYPLFIAAVGKLAPGGGKGETVSINGKVVGYAQIGQKFNQAKYFQGRPSAVNYNASGSAGSNKGPSNRDYLKDVQSMADSFLAHNPGIKKENIPSELITYSGSGLDPHLSIQGIAVQIPRIARARNLTQERVKALVDIHTEKPLLGIFGPVTVNVLELNIDLDRLN